MGRRHGRTPPYEIMQHTGSGAPLPRSGMRRVRGGSVGVMGLVWNGLKSVGGWFAGGLAHLRALSGGITKVQDLFRGRSSRATEVRLPWPVLALLGVVALAGMGLMFQIGQHVAGKEGAVAKQESQSPNGLTDTTAVEIADAEDAESAASGPVVPMPPRVARVEPIEPLGGAKARDPREPGLNYYILATVRKSEVDGVWALQQFLAERGVATFLDSANNGRFRVLVDVTRGFTREQSRNLEYADHEQMLRTLGREWKRSQGGIGTDLSDLYRWRRARPSRCFALSVARKAGA